MWLCDNVVKYVLWDIIVNTDGISLLKFRCSWVCYEASCCQMFQHYPTFKNSLSVFKQQFQKEFSFCFSKHVTCWNQWCMNCKQVALWRVSEVKREKRNQTKPWKIFLTFKGIRGMSDTRSQVVFLQVCLWQYLCKLVEEHHGRATEGPNYWHCRYDIQSTCRSRDFASHPWIYLPVRLVRRALDSYIFWFHPEGNQCEQCKTNFSMKWNIVEDVEACFKSVTTVWNKRAL